jgi:hypothetical protein
VASPGASWRLPSNPVANDDVENADGDEDKAGGDENRIEHGEPLVHKARTKRAGITMRIAAYKFEEARRRRLYMPRIYRGGFVPDIL